MDTLTIQGLQFHANHGLYDEEKIHGNDFEVDLVIRMDLRKAGQSDKIDHTFDYQEAEKQILAIMNGPSINLIEKLCLKIGESIFTKTVTIAELTVRVRKMNPPISTPTQFTQVEMQWHR